MAGSKRSYEEFDQGSFAEEFAEARRSWRHILFGPLSPVTEDFEIRKVAPLAGRKDLFGDLEEIIRAEDEEDEARWQHLTNGLNGVTPGGRIASDIDRAAFPRTAYIKYHEYKTLPGVKVQSLASRIRDVSKLNQKFVAKTKELATKENELATENKELMAKNKELAAKNKELAKVR